MTTRSIACTLLVGLVPFFIGCSSEKKTPAAANSWSGRTYFLDIPASHWKQPSGIGKDIGPSVPKFLLSISGSEVLVGTAGADGAQDMCGPTSIFTATSPYPDIQIGPANARVRIGDEANTIPVIATAYNFTMTNILSETPDASGPQGSFSAVIDAREVYSVFYQLADPTADSVCRALESISPCTPCPQDQANYCLALKAVALAAGPLTGPGVQPVEEANLAASCALDGGS